MIALATAFSCAALCMTVLHSVVHTAVKFVMSLLADRFTGNIISKTTYFVARKMQNINSINQSNGNSCKIPGRVSQGTQTLWKPVTASSWYVASLWSQRIRWSEGGPRSMALDDDIAAWCGHRRTTSCKCWGLTNFGVARMTQSFGAAFDDEKKNGHEASNRTNTLCNFFEY